MGGALDVLEELSVTEDVTYQLAIQQFLVWVDCGLDPCQRCPFHADERQYFRVRTVDDRRAVEVLVCSDGESRLEYVGRRCPCVKLDYREVRDEL